MSDSIVPVYRDYEQVQAGDIYPSLPIRCTEMHLDDLLYFAVLQGASDIKIYTDMALKLKIAGHTYAVTDRAFNNAELNDFVSRLYKGSNGITILASGKDIDVPYEIKPQRGIRHRFRVSMTSMHINGMQGTRITLRILPSIPPSVIDMKVPKKIIEGFLPSNGLVLVTGATGSGKSTLLASVIRYILEREGESEDILTFEAPIEFVYDEVKKDPGSIISQSQIPTDLHSFSAGVRNALRNNPDTILVGEMRDGETLTAGVEAALTGHRVYSTLHSNSVAATIKRISIGAGTDSAITVTDVIDSLRMVVSQRLLLNPGGGRTALREYKVFNQDDRNILLQCPVDHLPMRVEQMVKEAGTRFIDAAKAALNDGLIFEHDYLKIEAESSGVHDALA